MSINRAACAEHPFATCNAYGTGMAVDYAALLEHLGEQAATGMFQKASDQQFFAARPFLTQQQILPTLLRKQIIKDLLNGVQFATSLECKLALFDSRGLPLVPLCTDADKILARVMGAPDTRADLLAIHYSPVMMGPPQLALLCCSYACGSWDVLPQDPACYGALAPIAEKALGFAAWLRSKSPEALASTSRPFVAQEAA